MTLPSSGICFDVGAGAERAAGAGDDEKPDVVVGLGFVVGVAQLGDHEGAERVEGVGPVQRDGGLVPVDLVADGVVGLSGHRWSLRRVARRSSAVELRCASLPERGQAFLEIRCPAGQLEIEQFLVHRLGQGGVLAVVDGLLGQPDRDRRRRRPAGPAVPRRRRRDRPGRRRRGSAPSPRRRVPSTFSPSSSIRLARARPTSRGSSHVAPESGLKPLVDERLPEHRVVGGHGEVGGEREVAAEARRPSPARRTPRAGGWCATSSTSRWDVWGMRRTRSPVRGRWPPELVATQSAPAQKSSPSPRMWMARNESSAAASVSASTSASTIEWLNELRRAGRSSVSRRIAPSRCAVTAPSAEPTS